MSSVLYPKQLVAPANGLSVTGGSILSTTTIVNLTGANDWTLTPAQVKNTFVFVNSGTNSTIYTLNLPVASTLYTSLGSTVGATCTFKIYAVYSFNLYANPGGIYGYTIGNANGVSQGVPSGSSGTSVVFNFGQNTTTLLMPNGAAYTVTIAMTSSTAYNVFVQ